MKKILGLIILAVLVSSCYKDYIMDYAFSAIYFPYQTDVRTVVVGEGMKVQIGVALGGVRTNSIDRPVGFKLDTTLITPAILASMKTGATYIKNAVTSVTNLLKLPTTYYSLSNVNTMVIAKGQHSGYVTLTVDSVKFLADPLTLNANYVVPFYITSATADSILPLMRSNVVAIKYENMLFGNYWHGGVSIRKSAAGVPIDTAKYYTTIPTPEAKIWQLTTTAPFSLKANGYKDQVTAKPNGEMLLTLDGTNVIVASTVGSTFAVQPDGASTFNRAKLLQDRRIYLNYKYTNADGSISYCKDTLTFRNRIQDGINIWQDENPSHY